MYYYKMHRPGYCFSCGKYLTREDPLRCECGWIDPVCYKKHPSQLEEEDKGASVAIFD